MTAALQIENRRLRERVAELEDALGVNVKTPLTWRLTRREQDLFGVLYARKGIVGRVTALAAMYGGNPDDEPGEKIVDIYIMRLRRKLAPFDIEIETHWGQGWILTASGRTNAQAWMESGKL